VRKIQRGEFPTPHYNFLNEHTVNALKAAGDSLCVCVCGYHRTVNLYHKTPETAEEAHLHINTCAIQYNMYSKAFTRGNNIIQTL